MRHVRQNTILEHNMTYDEQPLDRTNYAYYNFTSFDKSEHDKVYMKEYVSEDDNRIMYAKWWLMNCVCVDIVGITLIELIKSENKIAKFVQEIDQAIIGVKLHKGIDERNYKEFLYRKRFELKISCAERAIELCDWNIVGKFKT